MGKTKQMEGDSAEVKWEAKGATTVAIVEGVFSESDTVTSGVLKAATLSDTPRVLLVADANVVQRTEGLGSRIGRYLQANGIALASAPIVLPGGEKLKCDNLQSVMKICETATKVRLGVRDVLIGLGGGTLLDTAGFAAAQIRGGVNLVRIPTTTAAMMDGAFADTAAVNYNNVKNALKMPSHPVAAIIDPTFTKTVLDGVWRGGFSELVRHAAVRDATLLKRLAAAAPAIRERDDDLMHDLIRLGVASRIGRGDSDFSLWCAHRLESMSGYKLPHGYAVAIAICIDCAYAVERGLLKEGDQELICRTLADCGALDGLAHSHHLLSQIDGLLKGLDDWRLDTGSEARTLPIGAGKGKPEDAPSRDSYRKVVGEFLAAYAGE